MSKCTSSIMSSLLLRCAYTHSCIPSTANINEILPWGFFGFFSWCWSGCPYWHCTHAHQSPLCDRTPSHWLLMPHGTCYFILIKINNWKKEINVCKLSVVTVGCIGLTLFFERLCRRPWLIYFCALCLWCSAAVALFILRSPCIGVYCR